ncbi:FAD/NAD(P)-binding domain-containing protein [Dendrothele bispora CBS 962.96]|uniref:FAD/NAD(P)-binding domain-containing protein n=1 Tax=Dendrothele bispora (strain CBS 962.96) TaxID=1314807 RepID=A0A4S8MTH8_DENBC|nr:FAD/NAD(P)-binding domain-containing protein [Dendrothele bispora CBS 962.96]
MSSVKSTPTPLPTLSRLNATLPPDVDASSVARKWLAAFSTAIEHQDTTHATGLFTEDGFWRDVLALTSDFRTIDGSQNIKALLDARLSPINPHNFEISEDRFRAPVVQKPVPDLVFLLFCFTFDTKVGKCSGIGRLVPTSTGDWKAYTMFTCLETLKDYPEKAGPNRASSLDPELWSKRRERESNFIDNDPTVLIIGAGHTGLELAIRLKTLGVSALIIDKNKRVGDNWRNRYETLKTHDTVWYNQTPYLSFPSTWPMYSPCVKLGNFLESYADLLELNVWTSTPIERAEWIESTKSWNVLVNREGRSRKLNVRHLVFATGFGAGRPNMPMIPNRDLFKGEVMHSCEFKSAKGYKGKKAIVVGACNSGHDLAQTLYEEGADVTMYQRSSTCVVSAKATAQILEPNFNEFTPTDLGDRLNASLPMPAVHGLLQMGAAYTAQTVDKPMMDGLAKTNFKTNLGPDNAGLFPLFLGRGGGYYLDTGASQLIIDGHIKVKHGSGIKDFTEHELQFEDGTKLPADIVVLATGYGDPRDIVSPICGPEVRAKLYPVWGLNEEQELNSVWRESGQEGLWFALGNLALSRFYSSALALRLKMLEENIMAPVY